MKKKPVKNQIKVIEISAKCSDLFSMGIVDRDGNTDWKYNGYVPGFFPDEHFGDYVMLRIDVSTGKILNWKKPSQETLQKTLAEKEKQESPFTEDEIPF